MRPLATGVATLLLLIPSPALAGDVIDPALDALRQQHFCEILGRLEAIHAAAPSLRHRYLTIEATGRPGYVQCLFEQGDRQMRCEAASGFYEAPRVDLVAPGKLPALAALGFATEVGEGNYRQRLTVTRRGGLPGIADMLLRTLHDIYGVTPDDHFRYRAPLAPAAPAAEIYSDGACAPATS